LVCPSENVFIRWRCRTVRLFSSLLFAIFCFAFYLNAYAQQNDQEVIVANFYKTILTFKDGGIPVRKNIDRLSPFISSDFRNLLIKVRVAEDKQYKVTKGSEPPLVEGSLFYSLFEGAHKYTAIKVEPNKKPVSYLVNLKYIDPYGKHEIVKWQDRAILIQENNKWVVHDLELLGKWHFKKSSKKAMMQSHQSKDLR
jgi:hypothetical protein